MDRLVITGGQSLSGEVTISGAKNAALPMLAATILGGGDCVISNLPDVADVRTMGKLLRMLGISVHAEEERMILNATHLSSTEAPYDLVRTMRASVLVLGPLVARFGQATVSLPGGCAIGSRPINLHLAGLEKLGAEVVVDHGYIRAKASRLKGAKICLDIPTVTGTENLMMAACLAEGTTILENAAKEPEIVDLASFLVKRGARITGAGTDVITIEGVSTLDPADHEVIPDRVEAGTFLAAGALPGGDVCISRCRPQHLEAVTMKLREAGVSIVEERDRLRVKGPTRLKHVDVKTLAYPGFPTDMQAQMMALMCLAEGSSLMTETVFEGRYMHVPELRRMGADVKVEGSLALITGVEQLTGAPVMASDLRASAGLVLAGLAAQGETEISRVYHLDRGYAKMENKLVQLGADVRRVKGSGGATAGDVSP